MDEQKREELEQETRTAGPAPEPAQPVQRYAAPEIDDDDEDDAPTEWVPSRFEKKIHAIPDRTWDLYQIAGGVVIGAFTVAALFLGGSGLNVPFLVAIVLALFVPNWLEDRGRRKLTKGRMAMVIVIGIGLVALVLYTGITRGWNFRQKKEEAETAARLASMWLSL